MKPMFPKPPSVPYVKDSPTSKAAARTQKRTGRAVSDRERILRLHRSVGDVGLTCGEVEDTFLMCRRCAAEFVDDLGILLGEPCPKCHGVLDPMKHQTASARIFDLVKTGLIEESGRERPMHKGSTGSLARVTVAVQKGKIS